MIANSIQHFWSKVLFQELSNFGVSCICIAPGSRSTCLVKAVSENNSFSVVTHYDERSLGFFALGVAKASGKPVAVITTSGSAVANLIPSSVEALNLQIPLIFITADRPQELQNCGANQTLNQCAVFSGACAHQLDVSAPSQNSSALNTFVLNIRHAMQVCLKDGPIHVNMSFREPFFDKQASFSNLYAGIPAFSKLQKEKNNSQKLDLICNQLQSKKVLCIAAATKSSVNQDYVFNWAKKYNIPILCESTSSLTSYSDKVLHYPDTIIEELIKRNQLPDTLICIGAKWISKNIAKLIQKVNKGVLIHDFNATQDWIKTHLHEFINIDLSGQNYLPCILSDPSYTTQLKQLQQELTTDKYISDPKHHYMVALSKILGQYNVIFVGNSLAVRHINSMFKPLSPMTIFTQRGLSGIDGLISTGAGIAFYSKKRTAIVIGDTSFLYDLNGLYFLTKQLATVDIFILNNNGGRIFESLPIKNDPILNDFFVMPHELTFESISSQFKCGYISVNSLDELKSVSLKDTKKSQIIEINLHQ